MSKVLAIATTKAYHDNVVVRRGQKFWIEKKLLKGCLWAKAVEKSVPIEEAPPEDEVDAPQDENVENSEGDVL